jgi:hypothetical protein
VRVEADRGEDIGVVQSIAAAKEFTEAAPTAGYRGRGYSTNLGERKWLYRPATVTERLQISDKLEDEQAAVTVIRQKIAERELPMSILDAEYQFDRHKLVFFFVSASSFFFLSLLLLIALPTPSNSLHACILTFPPLLLLFIQSFASTD